MSDRPTYKDFKQSRTEGNVIMTPDGSLYAILNMWLYKLFKFFSNVLLGAVGFISMIMVFFNGMWPNLMFEFFFAAFVLSQFLAYPKYILLRFIRLEPGNLDHKEASSWFPPQQEQRQTSSKIFDTAGKVILACMAVFILLNSHTAQLVRSLFDSPRLVSMEVTDTQENGDDEVLYSAGGDNSQFIIPFPAGEHPQRYAEIHVSRTLTLAHMTLDGQPLRNYSSDKQLSWFWEPEYLKQQFFLYLGDVRDGSVLTLTCGSLTREWEFDVTDKEAS